MNHDDEDDQYYDADPDILSDEDIVPEVKKTKEVEVDFMDAALKSVASNKGKYYLTNQDLLPAVIESKAKGFMTDKLAKMLMLLANGIARKSNYSGYSYKDDMKSEALVNLCRNALKFDPAKSSNPFAYYTTAIERSFLQFMAEEKKEHYIRDKMLVDSGKDPSHNFENNPITRKLKLKQDKKRAAKDDKI